MRVLGVHCETHESSIALLEDGEVTFAAAEERYSRKKMDTAAPVLAIRQCLAARGLRPSDLDVVAVSGFGPPRNWFGYASSFVRQKHFARWRDICSCRYMRQNREVQLRGVTAVLANAAFCTGLPQFAVLYLARMAQVKQELSGFRGNYVYVPHHLGHAAGACYSAGFPSALSVVIEGYDWLHTLAIDRYDGGESQSIARTPWPHSPGYFYMLATVMLGFNYLRHAGKITGLAAYGDPAAAYDKVKNLIWVEGMELRTSPLIFTLSQEYALIGKIPQYFAGFSPADLAAAFQRRLEDVCVDVVTQAVTRTGSSRVVLSGGVAANVLLNKRILAIPGVEDLHVHPAMSDAGQAFGAAAHAYCQATPGRPRSRKLEHVYLGEEYSDAAIAAALRDSGVCFKRIDDIEAAVARLLAQRQVVARFNGRMEYGPRALGNRSVLCHTGERDVNDWLNQRLQRTEFMPFAPSVLYEDRHEYLLDIDRAENAAEFMAIAVDCTERMKRECPAVVHLDGTARPQLVRREVNASYHRILTEFKALTGVGVLLNTSFNMHEEPIVCSPADAIRAFQCGRLDHLAIGNYLVSGAEQSGAAAN